MNVRSDADQLVYSSSSFERKAVGVRFIHTGDELPVFFTDSACPSVFSTVTVTWLLKAELTDGQEALQLTVKASFTCIVESGSSTCEALAVCW